MMFVSVWSDQGTFYAATSAGVVYRWYPGLPPTPGAWVVFIQP